MPQRVQRKSNYWMHWYEIIMLELELVLINFLQCLKTLAFQIHAALMLCVSWTTAIQSVSVPRE